MKPYGHHKKGHNVHSHNICGLCTGDAPQTHSAGRAWHKEEMQKELDVELSHVLCECEECEPERFQVEDDKIDEFLWRDKEGNLLSIYTLDTTYLMNIFLMVYNNLSDFNNRVGRYKLQLFPSFYTVEYMITAIEKTYDELKKRKLSPEQSALMELVERNVYNNNGIENLAQNYEQNQNTYKMLIS